MSDHVSCIDISHWQDYPDFEAVAASGVVAMIHKATEGTGYIDPNRGENIRNAMDAGIACCTFHWLKPGDAADQMQFYLDVIEPVGGERMVIDYEESGCQLDDLEEAVSVLLDAGRRLQVTVYSGHLLKEQLNGSRNELLANNTDLWLAQYTSGSPSWSTGTYPKWTLWQYSETGEVDGVNGSLVDLNAFDGSDAELVRWISPAGFAPPSRPVLPTQPAPREIVTVGIEAPDTVRVSVNVNGRLLRQGGPRRPARRGPDIVR
jgi:lysozyme